MAAGARVLVVDDQAIDRLLVQSLLSESGYVADTAADGQEAIESVLRRRYGLILMDMGMPGMSGIETALRIRDLGGKAAQIPIVAISTKSPADFRQDYLSARLNGHVSKPIRPVELLAIVSGWLGRPDAGAEDPAAPDAALLLDEAKLAGMKAEMVPELFHKLISSYLVGTDLRLARIEASIMANDLTAVAREAHDLKSTSGGFGAPRLHRLARQLEKACKSYDLPAVADVGLQIRAAFEATGTAMAHWIESAASDVAEG